MAGKTVELFPEKYYLFLIVNGNQIDNQKNISIRRIYQSKEDFNQKNLCFQKKIINLNSVKYNFGKSLRKLFPQEFFHFFFQVFNSFFNSGSLTNYISFRAD